MKLTRRILLFLVAILSPLIISGAFILLGHPDENGRISVTGETTSTPEGYEDLVRESKLVLADSAKQALITINGKDELVDLPTVESVDSGKSTECPGDTDCGRGAAWAVDVSTPATFKNATNGQCVNTDGYYGSQCWDLGDLFWRNYANRGLNTCGTGAAKGTIQNGCWQKNAGSNFDMIWDKNQIKAGDWVVFNNGEWGHIGMAVGNSNGGYVALFGTNQGGAACPGGGSSANTINISLANFAGAFRPKSYVAVVPTPTEPTKPTVPNVEAPVSPSSYVVRRGDTLGGIALKNGWWGSTNGLYGDSGYAQQLADKNNIQWRGLIYPNQVINK